MKFRVLGAILTLGLLSPALTSCAAPTESVTPTPVAFKACLVTGPAGANDGGFNQHAYFGLQQAVVTTGASYSVVQATGHSADAVTRAGKKLVSRGCNLVLAGQNVGYEGLLPLANGNPKVHFGALGFTPSANASATAANLDAISFDSASAYLQAGYLAAASSTNHVIGVIAANTPEAIRAVWFFRQGVQQFDIAKGASTLIAGAVGSEVSSWSLLPVTASASKVRARTASLAIAGADVLFPVGVDGLAATEVAMAHGSHVIGSDSNWALEPRYAQVEKAILASVELPISGAIVYEVDRSIGGSDPGAMVFLGKASISEDTANTWPAGVGGELNQLASDYEAGKLTSVIQPLN